jgi:hypothetical protein
MLKVLETRGLDSLFISVAVHEGESPESEFGPVKEVLLEWQRAHGASPNRLTIEIQTEESKRHEILRHFFQVVSSTDPLLYQFYQNVREAEICLVSPTGKRFKKVGFSHSPK